MTSPESPIRTTLEQRAHGVIAHVIINNDRKLNTLNSDLMTVFVAELGRLGQMDDLRAVVLTGAGERAFVGGADITEMADLDPHSARQFITRVHACCHAVRAVPVPVIARIQGFTFGAGLELAAACDLRVAAEGAKFGMPEVKLGIPSVVEAALLPMLIGWGRTRRLLLLGETISAGEAESWGFVEACVPADALDSTIETWIGHLFESGPRAIRLQKALIRQWEDLPLRAAVQAGVDCFAESWRSEEPRLAMKAFLDAQAARKRAR